MPPTFNKICVAHNLQIEVIKLNTKLKFPFSTRREKTVNKTGDLQNDKQELESQESHRIAYYENNYTMKTTELGQQQEPKPLNQKTTGVGP